MIFTGKYLCIQFTISSFYGSIPLTLVLIERDGDLSTLCHSCRFDYQLRVQKRFLSLAMSAPRMGQSDYDIYCLLVNLYWLFFHEHSRFAGQHKKREGIFLTSHYNFHPFHRHLDISRAITVESLPLHTQLAAGLRPGILYIYIYILSNTYIRIYCIIYIFLKKKKHISKIFWLLPSSANTFFKQYSHIYKFL